MLSGACARPTLAQAPDEAWRVLDTEHFDVTYPAELRALATRVADRAERAYVSLAEAFDQPPKASIDIVVTDHTDVSNGFARVSPWNRITIFAPPPMEGFELAYFDDWVELVVTHELAHIFHLDRRGWLGRVTKAVFGRAPIRWPIFPNSATPTWVVEGLATYYESDLTDAGRTHGSYHDMVLRAAILEDQFESLDQVAGETQVWPAGNRPYIYGSRFFQHLTEEHGRDRMAEFAGAVDGQIIPFRINAAARKSFGVTFKEAFGIWRGDLAEEYSRLVEGLEKAAPLTEPVSLASDGRRAVYPRVAPDGSTLAYARSDGSSDTQIRLVDLGGGSSGKLTRTNGMSLLDWTPDGRVVFSQSEFVDPYRRFRDLYLAVPSGRVSRITRGARLDYPSVGPDGRTAVAIQQGGGDMWIVTVDLDTGQVERVTEPEAGVHWAYPAWSPDGRWIAASRWTPGSFYDVVVLDASGAVVAQVTADRAVDLAPTWSPDGKWLLCASDRTGVPNVFAAEVGAGGQIGALRQVTHLTTGASYPEVGPGTDWLYFSGYHADGWHLERVPFDPATWFDPLPTDGRFLQGGEAAAGAFPDSVGGPERRYSAFPSVLPRYWEPTLREGETRFGQEVIGASIGLRTTGFDLAGRHALSLTARFEPKGSRVNGGIAYSFAGLGNPVLGLSAEQVYASSGSVVQDPVEEGAEPEPRAVFILERERRLRATASLVRRRVRNVFTFTLGAAYLWQHRDLLNDALEPDSVFVPSRPTSGLPELTATLAYSNARVHPFSISREDGVSGFLRVRRRWDATAPDSLAGELGLDASLVELTGEARLYKAVRLPGFSNHVLSLRVSGGAAGDSGADQFHFSVGGASGQSERITGLELLSGSNLLFPVRGYDRGIRSGRYAWTASAEYRFPLARINRGLGDFPLYFDWISGAAFFDAGNAWGPELGEGGFQNPRQDDVMSLGAEVLLSGLPLWTLPTVLRTGVALPLVEGDGARVYVRLGVSF